MRIAGCAVLQSGAQRSASQVKEVYVLLAHMSGASRVAAMARESFRRPDASRREMPPGVRPDLASFATARGATSSTVIEIRIRLLRLYLDLA